MDQGKSESQLWARIYVNRSFMSFWFISPGGQIKPYNLNTWNTQKETFFILFDMDSEELKFYQEVQHLNKQEPGT